MSATEHHCTIRAAKEGRAGLTRVLVPRQLERTRLGADGVERVERRADPQPLVRPDPGRRGAEGAVEDEPARLVHDEEVQEPHGEAEERRGRCGVMYCRLSSFLLNRDVGSLWDTKLQKRGPSAVPI